MVSSRGEYYQGWCVRRGGGVLAENFQELKLLIEMLAQPAGAPGLTRPSFKLARTHNDTILPPIFYVYVEYNHKLPLF